MNYSKISQLNDRISPKKSFTNLLPKIFKVEKYYVNKETSKIKDLSTQISRKNKNLQKSFTVDVGSNIVNDSYIQQDPIV